MAATAFRKIIGSTNVNKPQPEFSDPQMLPSTWDKYEVIANPYNAPGKFPAFVGFDWTSAPEFQNLHHCVIFADTGPEKRFTAFDSLDLEELRCSLEQQRKPGLDGIAVHRNGNATDGLMFSARDMSGKSLTLDYAGRRMANEPPGQDHLGLRAE